MELAERREHLLATANPDRQLDYLSCLSGHLKTSLSDTPLSISLRYVPDRLILKPEGWNGYLEVLSVLPWASLEELGASAIDDMNDQLLPQWIGLRIALEGPFNTHQVILEEQQPGWDNSDLLSRYPL